MKRKGTTAETCFVFVKLTFLVWFSSPSPGSGTYSAHAGIRPKREEPLSDLEC